MQGQSRRPSSYCTNCTHLALHIHDDHRVGAVAHDEVLRVLGQQGHVVDGDVGAGRRAQRFVGAAALGGLHVPHLTEETSRDGAAGVHQADADSSYLHRAVGGRADDVVPVRSEGGLVDEGRVAAELLQSFTRLQSVNSEGTSGADRSGGCWDST